MKIPLCVKKTQTKFNESKKAFECYYYNVSTIYHEKMHDINLFLITISLIFMSIFDYLFLILLWKSSSGWTTVETASIGYFHYRLGYYLSVKEYRYLNSLVGVYGSENILKRTTNSPVLDQVDKELADMLLALKKTTKMD
jgi:hypothetical protein